MAKDEKGYPPQLWHKMGEMGWMGLIIPEEYGGAGASFFDLVAIGQQAERCSERLKKGSAVLVEGRLRSRSWVSQNGDKRSKVEILVGRIQFLDKMGTEPDSTSVPEPEVDERNIPPENLDDLPF